MDLARDASSSTYAKMVIVSHSQIVHVLESLG